MACDYKTNGVGALGAYTHPKMFWALFGFGLAGFGLAGFGFGLGFGLAGFGLAGFGLFV